MLSSNEQARLMHLWGHRATFLLFLPSSAVSLFSSSVNTLYPHNRSSRWEFSHIFCVVSTNPLTNSALYLDRSLHWKVFFPCSTVSLLLLVHLVNDYLQNRSGIKHETPISTICLPWFLICFDPGDIGCRSYWILPTKIAIYFGFSRQRGSLAKYKTPYIDLDFFQSAKYPKNLVRLRSPRRKSL